LLAIKETLEGSDTDHIKIFVTDPTIPARDCHVTLSVDARKATLAARRPYSSFATGVAILNFEICDSWVTNFLNTHLAPYPKHSQVLDEILAALHEVKNLEGKKVQLQVGPETFSLVVSPVVIEGRDTEKTWNGQVASEEETGSSSKKGDEPARS
jgi:hypothetical protein